MAKVILLLLVATLALVQANNTFKVGNRTVVLRHIKTTFFDADLSCKREGKRLFAPRNEQEINDAHGVMTSHLNYGNSVWVAYFNLHLSTDGWVNLHTGGALHPDFWTRGNHGDDDSQNCMFMTNLKAHEIPRLLSEAHCIGKLPYFCELCTLD